MAVKVVFTKRPKVPRRRSWEREGEVQTAKRPELKGRSKHREGLVTGGGPKEEILSGPDESTQVLLRRS